MPQNTKIQIRRGASTQWCSVNPVLSAGEPALETDTNKFKIGDGTLTWNQLPYVGFDGGDMDVEEVSHLGAFTSGSTQITFSSLFDTDQSVRSYKGTTGAALIVPAGYDLAVYIDSSGNVTQEQVTAGQVIYFRSDILLGNEWRRMTCNADQGCIDSQNGEYNSKAGCDASCARGYRCLSDAGCKEGWSNLEMTSKETCETNCKKFWQCDPVTACQQNENFSFNGMSEELCEAECILRNVCELYSGCRRYAATKTVFNTGGAGPHNIVDSCADCCQQADGGYVPSRSSCDPYCNPNACQNPLCAGHELSCPACIGQPGFDNCSCDAEFLTNEQKCFCNKPGCTGAWCEGCNCMEGQKELNVWRASFVPGGKCPGPDITFMPGEIKSQGGVVYCNTCEECEKCRHDGKCVPAPEKPGCGSSSSSYTPLPMMGRNPMEITW
jgi:hypothetical protein